MGFGVCIVLWWLYWCLDGVCWVFVVLFGDCFGGLCVVFGVFGLLVVFSVFGLVGVLCCCFVLVWVVILIVVSCVVWWCGWCVVLWV